MGAHETSAHKDASYLSSTSMNRFKSNPGTAKTLTVEIALDRLRKACSGVIEHLPYQGTYIQADGAKTKALLADLAALRVTDPNMHAVVFTHHKPAHDHLSKRLAECGYEVCGFRGGVSAEKKHKTIRYFQESAEAAGRAAAASSSAAAAKKGRASSSAAPKAKVFVVTMKVGNVGITLTAATRVYLMEPCLDPAMEVQAAGRIHRLGQTKPVLVKRLCYKDSIDVRILELHKQIRAGKISIVDNVFPPEAIDVLKG